MRGGPHLRVAQKPAILLAVAAAALYGLLLMLYKKTRDGRLARREKRLRARIGGELALERLRAEARLIQSGSRARCRTYISLAVCTGLAIAVILV